MEIWDAVIVGAGAAGLCAARELSRAGVKPLIIEAQSRIGGRIFTHFDLRSPIPLELGAEFVHGHPPVTSRLLDEFRITRYQIPDSHFYSGRSRIVPLPHFWEDLNRVLNQIGFSGEDHPLREELESLYYNRELRRFLPLTQAYVEGFHGADPKTASGHSLAAAEREFSGPAARENFRIQHGHSQLAEALLRGANCELRLNAVVKTVRWKPGFVFLEVNSRTGTPLPPIRARKLLVTIPASLLRAPESSEGAIRFEPLLNEKRSCLDRIRTGPVNKILLIFRGRFWETAPSSAKIVDVKLANFSFLHTTAPLPFPTCWSALPFQVPILTAWAGGPQAYSALGRSIEDQVEEAILSISRMMGFEAPFLEDQLESWYSHDWQSDPYSRGAYSFPGVGGESAARELSEPIADTIFFAGEATEFQGQSGTVEGALASGERAAKRMSGRELSLAA